MPKGKKQDSASVAFKKCIDTAGHLQWKAGLQAIKASEGGGQISGENSKHLLGGAAVDEDCKTAYPNANRWDYVVGYDRSKTAVAYFIEVHSAETSGISEVAKKLAWLREFLQQDAQARLAMLPREFHWVASGRINIPKHVPQFKLLQTTLRKLGLKGPAKQLILT